ncbi:short-subunit dehydrogenase [Maritimibacter alkaliphilus HTCC2654]|uniref:Oxidoreductase, short-chain dehydrogenase/reductase family protein n=1 Tax=Maritimibacter alkaliphilus HTCC2654 TaxID=314271 RepID=A3VEL0_9RHOB|nr:SDR family NAD(P)-dependent oxidoreductase [Maritimibacter alkaliphilus]EAQ13348.1 oxidoreductase, short-chain dehydrogenase/reductase family protein [Rhodobacterales bacterium HTCC2654] [Maritimibacter alkaliphilus HTCC2654]TYP85233.1 short-subunit dehydrogenase [Maritimibacter alkaliphilus HTCC2654]
MRILVTGANRGIGAALVAATRLEGHDVVTHSRSGAGTDIACDLSDVAAIAGAFGGLGRIDVLVNNAGIIGPDRQSTLDMDFEGFAETLTINTLAPLAVAQAVLPALRASGQGKIVTVSSQMAWMGYAKSDRIAYRASKAAVNKVMQGLATDLAADRIPVALVDPGWVQTDMGGPEADVTPDEVATGILGLIERLSMSDTGKFFKFTGEERPF